MTVCQSKQKCLLPEGTPSFKNFYFIQCPWLNPDLCSKQVNTWINCAPPSWTNTKKQVQLFNMVHCSILQTSGFLVSSLQKEISCSLALRLLPILMNPALSWLASRDGHQITQNPYTQVQHYHLKSTQVWPTNRFHLVYPFPTSSNDFSVHGYHSLRTMDQSPILCRDNGLSINKPFPGDEIV